MKQRNLSFLGALFGSIGVCVMVIFFVEAASVTPAFPASLNNFSEGAVIEEEDWNAIESEIGIRSSAAVRDSINWKLFNGSFATTSIRIGTTASTTISGTGTSTFGGGIESTVLNITSTSATSTFSNGIQIQGGTLRSQGALDILSLGSSTFSGGISTAGISSSNGLLISTGNLNVPSGIFSIGGTGSSTITNGLSAGGLSSSNGLTLTGGNLLSSGLLTITNVGTSTFTGALSSSHLQATSLTSSGALSLFSIGANSILFQTNGSERAVLTSGGNLGIGTTTPGTLLSVAGVGVFGGSTGTTTIQHGVNLATLGGGVTIATTSPSTSYKLLVDGAATIVQKRIASAASPTLNWSDSNYQIMALSQAGHSISFTGGQPGATLRLELCQDSTGNRTVTSWGSNILFMTSDLTNSTSTPGLTTKANTCNLFSFTVSVGTSTQIYRGTLPLKDK